MIITVWYDHNHDEKYTKLCTIYYYYYPALGALKISLY